MTPRWDRCPTEEGAAHKTEERVHRAALEKAKAPDLIFGRLEAPAKARQEAEHAHFRIAVSEMRNRRNLAAALNRREVPPPKNP